MLKKLDEIKNGYNLVTTMDDTNNNMMMDIGLLKLQANDEKSFVSAKNESAFLLLTGKVTIRWDDNVKTMERKSVFNESPYCLHVAAKTKVTIVAECESELLVQETDNDGTFPSKFYTPEDCTSENFGEGVWRDTALRVVRTVFDYSNAPYSNMVMGEVLTYPGKWSSYPPHHHPQPEVYLYKFDKPQGFGCSVIGEDVYKIKHNSFAMIPGGLVHPQTSAPGYAMYYCWMIRHLEQNPWTDRVNEKCHEWLLEKNVKIWPEV